MEVYLSEDTKELLAQTVMALECIEHHLREITSDLNRYVEAWLDMRDNIAAKNRQRERQIERERNALVT